MHAPVDRPSIANRRRPQSLSKHEAMAEATRIALPGFGRPLDHATGTLYSTALMMRDEGGGFGPTLGVMNDDSMNVILGRCRRSLLTLREITMTRLMNSLTDKEDWHRKVFDDAIASKWKSEALATPGVDMSEKMVDWVSLLWPHRQKTARIDRLTVWCSVLGRAQA